jgi:hypothetical protein
MTPSTPPKYIVYRRGFNFPEHVVRVNHLLTFQLRY